jgi:ABC-type sugar transport system permease subunit
VARGRSVAVTAHLFLLPACLLLLIFRVAPALSAVAHSFTSWDGVRSPTFVGLTNFAKLLRDGVFWTALKNNLLVALSIPLWILVSLVLALLIHQEVFGWRFFRATFFLPSVLSPVIIGILFAAFLGPSGPVNQGLRTLGLKALALEWLGNPHSALPTLVMVILWGIFGHGVIVFLAGLAAVPREIFEAARLDGATGWTYLWHIVVPSLRHVIEFWGVNLVVWSFTSLFAFIYVMTQGGPGYATMLVSYQVYQQAFEADRMGYACALGTALFLMVFGLVLLQIRLMAGKEE